MRIATMAPGNSETARQLLERVVAIDARIFGPESMEVAADLEGLAEVQRSMGREAEAAEVESRMNAIREILAQRNPAGS